MMPRNTADANRRKLAAELVFGTIRVAQILPSPYSARPPATVVRSALEREPKLPGEDDRRVWSLGNIVYAADLCAVKEYSLVCTACRAICRRTCILTECKHRLCAECTPMYADTCPGCYRAFSWALGGVVRDHEADRIVRGLRVCCALAAATGCT